MKRFLSLIIIISMLGILAGCGKGNTAKQSQETPETVAETEIPSENKTGGTIVVYFSRTA